MLSLFVAKLRACGDCDCPSYVQLRRPACGDATRHRRLRVHRRAPGSRPTTRSRAASIPPPHPSTCAMRSRNSGPAFQARCRARSRRAGRAARSEERAVRLAEAAQPCRTRSLAGMCAAGVFPPDVATLLSVGCRRPRRTASRRHTRSSGWRRRGQCCSRSATTIVADPESARTYADAAARVANMFTSSA